MFMSGVRGVGNEIKERKDEKGKLRVSFAGKKKEEGCVGCDDKESETKGRKR